MPLDLSRRNILTGLATGLFCAPAIIRTPGLLMPIKAFVAEPDRFSVWVVNWGDAKRYYVPVSTSPW